MKNFNVLIGKMIKELRERKNFSQKEVSVILKKDPSTISYWETGRRQMNIGDLILYLNAIRATSKEIDDLFKFIARINKDNYSFDYKKTR